ncbi:MAG TPA: AmmeMemoRadiSam system protein B [Anaerolineae bacterium]|nr:AmmeMemoRadiSam system protein B [Anaerolineae bacterium]HIQ06678.1 AmmeMemoRadiSam system protein B [Anaerolineae bacterium]
MSKESTIRRPAVAGRFYPDNPEELRYMLSSFMQQADTRLIPGVHALIVPHAGYVYSGPVAAYGYRQLQVLAPMHRVIYLLGPAHYVPVAGAAVGDYEAFDTPLGRVPVAHGRVQALLAQGWPFSNLQAAHEPEHCLEVQLPFLQVTLDDFAIVPILCGQADPMEIATGLVTVLEGDDVVIVSSDLSHYYPYEMARAMDQQLLDDIVRGDIKAAADGEACGINPILALMKIASDKGWQPRLLDYRTSGDTGGGRHQVVGYAAVAYA